MEIELKEIYHLAIVTAIEAAEEVMTFFRKDSLETTLKNDDSPVTQADINSSRIIEDALAQTGIPVLSEEGEEIAYEERKKWTKLWIVDPLDGTKEFIKGRENFTVNIGLVENGEPQFGVIVIPYEGLVYFGGKKIGSYCATVSDFEKGILTELPSEITPEKTLVIAGGRKTGEEFYESHLKEMKSHQEEEFVQVASSVKFCMIAEGKVDFYPRNYPCMEWDTAAGQALLNGIGKNVYHHLTGNPLRYNKEDLYVPFFVSY